MMQAVDLSNLREMTAGDKELEKNLFAEFFISAEESIKELETNCAKGKNELWRKAAHAFKGVAYNLGAKNLGDLCAEAQKIHNSSIVEKEVLLSQIKENYQQAKKFLEEQK